MAGKMCPGCSEFTFFETPTGRLCSKCGYEMKIPVNNGKGGKGQKCSNCGRYTVFDGTCNSCNAKFIAPKN